MRLQMLLSQAHDAKWWVMVLSAWGGSHVSRSDISCRESGDEARHRVVSEVQCMLLHDHVTGPFFVQLMVRLARV